VRFWKEGKLKELEDYCRQDVKVTKEVYEFGKKNKHLLFEDRWTGEKKQVDVNFELDPTSGATSTNLTLGL